MSPRGDDGFSMRSVNAEIVRKGLTSSADPDNRSARDIYLAGA